MNTDESARPLAGGTGRQENTGRASSTINGTRLADRLLARLDGVAAIGPDQWTAHCPAHPDSHPSLSIRDTGERVLVHCFGGCDPEAVLWAVGLRFADLFASTSPCPAVGSAPRASLRRIPRRDLEATLYDELHVLLQVIGNRVASRQLARSKALRMLRPEWMPFPDGFWERELQAARRVRKILTLLYGADLDRGVAA